MVTSKCFHIATFSQLRFFGTLVNFVRIFTCGHGIEKFLHYGLTEISANLEFLASNRLPDDYG